MEIKYVYLIGWIFINY